MLTHLSHAALYRKTRALVPPDCPGPAEFVGPIRVPETGGKAALWHCPRCRKLICVEAGRVLWECETPPAAVPASWTEDPPCRS